MVMTKSELIDALRHEVHILLHLAGKVDRTTLGYRPTPKQRSTFELLQYLSMMGPALVDLRAEITMFGTKTTRGAWLVNLVLCGCAAYRTQLFLYLKACGRDELSTMNLWAGMDDPAAS